MGTRHRPLSGRAVLYAEGGAAAHAPADSVEAFRLAQRLGATGVATSVHLDRHGVAVIGGTGALSRIRRSRPAPLDAVLDELDGGIRLALTPVDDRAAEAAVDAALRHGALARLTLCHPEPAIAAAWRIRHPAVAAVGVTSRLGDLAGGLERAVAAMRDQGIGVLRLPREDWTAGRVALVHRFGREAWASGASHERMAVELLHMGVDAVGSDHVDRLVDAAAAIG